jgi:hypothetical protein
MAKANRTTSIPRRATAAKGTVDYSRAFQAFDLIEDAVYDAARTFRALAALIDNNALDEALLLTMERHLARDMAALGGAYNKARTMALRPAEGGAQ